MIQVQPPPPRPLNLLEVAASMIGAPSSSCVTLSRQNPSARVSISQVTRVKPSALFGSENKNRWVCASVWGACWPQALS